MEQAGPFDNSCVLWFNQMRTTTYGDSKGVDCITTRRRFFEGRGHFILRHNREAAAVMSEHAAMSQLRGKARS